MAKMLVVGPSGKGGATSFIKKLISHKKTNDLEVDWFIDKFDSKPNSFPIKFFESLKLLLQLLKYNKNVCYDYSLLICNSSGLSFSKNFIQAIILRIITTKFLVRFGGSTQESFFRKGSLSLLFQYFFAIQDLSIFQSKNLTKIFQPYMSKNLAYMIMPNFVDKEKISNDFVVPKNPLDVIFVSGPDYKRKGLVTVLNIINRVNAKDFNFTGIGTPDKLLFLESKFENLTLLPYLNKQDVEKLMSNSHILLLPTQNEGFPNIVVEAMSKGLPVISSKAGALVEIIENGVNGYTIVNSDCDLFLSKLLALSRNPDKYKEISKKNIETVKRLYCQEKVFDVFLNRINTLDDY